MNNKRHPKQPDWVKADSLRGMVPAQEHMPRRIFC